MAPIDQPLGVFMKRIFIRDCRTNCLLDRNEGWTNDEARAQNFPTTLNAVVYAVKKELHEVQLLIRFDGDAPDVVVRVDDEHMQTAHEYTGSNSGRC